MKLVFDKKLVIFYLVVGAGYFFLGWFNTWHTYQDRVWDCAVNNLWGIIFLIPLNFIFFEYSIPFVFKKRKYVINNVLLGILLLWVHMMLWSYASYVWRLLGIELHIYTPLRNFSKVNEVLQNQMAYSMAGVFFFGIVRHIYNYVRLKQATQLLRIEKQGAELNYLKSQTNPHFLFNTLNNIYSLARDKSDLAPESILRLSKILRFMLYETGGNFISIEQEIQIIGDYIDLEKLRYDESLRVNFNYDIEDMKQAIPPLLLIPLVENSFKHGVSETRHQPFVDIHLSVRDRRLMLVVKNSIEESSGDQRIQESIGLGNLRRQLELLYKDYNLSVERGSSVFTATLKINLASHV
jgi:two-component system, LytTR family, sensor kinase